MKKFTKGFTLIELLVVIAIIGILAVVVLASLSSARERSADAAIKSNLDTVRKQAAIYFNGAGNGSYGTDLNHAGATCSARGGSLATTLFVLDSNINAALLQAETKGISRCAVSDSGDAYALAVRLSTNYWWCIDSTGAVKESTSVSSPDLDGSGALARCE